MHGSKWALHQAKSNIDKWFPVVAVLERMIDSLRVLEHRLPKFFSGAKQLYEELGGTIILHPDDASYYPIFYMRLGRSRIIFHMSQNQKSRL